MAHPLLQFHFNIDTCMEATARSPSINNVSVKVVNYCEHVGTLNDL